MPTHLPQSPQWPQRNQTMDQALCVLLDSMKAVDLNPKLSGLRHVLLALNMVRVETGEVITMRDAASIQFLPGT